MAWIRKVRTASGATAVQIAESVAGRRRIVRHVGSARDEAELGLLVDDQQAVLDLGITPSVVAKAAMVSPAMTAGLFPDPALVPVQVVPRARVLKTSSTLLYDALAGVYTDLGFDVVGDEVFRDLVIARVVEPTSLLDVDRVLADVGRRAQRVSRHVDAPCAVLTRVPTATRSRHPVSTTHSLTATSVWCFTTSPPSTSRPRRKTTSGRSGSPKNAGSTRRSSWACSLIGTGFHSRSAATRATRPRPSPSSQS